MSSRAALWLDRMGLLVAARRVRHRLFPDHESVRFPSYPEAIAKLVRDSGDPARYASLALAVGTLEREGIAGEFAEVGVYRGATSRFLAACAPGRTLHLFDTFEGFAEKDREPENASDSRFQATSEATVRRAIGVAANVHIHAGYFPSTAAGKRWSKQSHYATTRQLLAQAGLDGSEGGTFKLRHTFALRQLRRGTSPEEVARWMGVEVEVMDRYKHIMSSPMDVV